MNEERVRQAFEQGYAYRMSMIMRIQHVLFALCLSVLAVSGLALMFHDTMFGAFLINLEGGFEGRGTIHRGAAIVLIALSIFHIGYLLFTRTGRQELSERMLRAKDFGDFLEAVRYNAGRAESPPLIGKFGFGQKVHFLLAGIIVISMMVSGFILWFPTAAMSFLPQWAMRVVLVVHGYEGLIAFIVLVLWHLYDIHLSRKNFPMSEVWLSGLMPLEKVKRYHPGEYQKILKIVGDDDK